MSYEGADFGFVGGAYEAPDILQNAQRLQNWYTEISGDNPKMPIALLGCPGLNPVIATQAGQVRGFWVLPGNTTALVVTADTVYLLSVVVPATQSSIAQLSVASVGTLLTNVGPVCIRDNGTIFGGLGGYAVLVDGQYGYLYRMSGPGTATMTVSTTVGHTDLPITSAINYQFLAGMVVTAGSGGLSAGTTVVSLDFTNQILNVSQPAFAGTAGNVLTVTIPAFQQITDPAFLGASRVAFIEGWLIFNQPGTRTFYTNAPIPYTVGFSGIFYALKDSSTDNLITLHENNRELWLVGERTSEVWFNSGGTNFAFTRIPGVGPQIGCSAQHSITRLGSSLAWMARNEQGENMVVVTKEYSYERMSTHAIEHALSGYPVVSDGIGYAYQEEGHLFYMMVLPTADTTWCFDATTNLWHQRLSYDPAGGQFHRHRSNCYADFADLRLVGDYQSGYILQMSRQFYVDGYSLTGAVVNSNPLRCVRRTPYIWSREDRKRVYMSALQIEFTPGVGLNTGQGSNPQAMLRWQDEYGAWSNEHWTTIGAIGVTRNRAIWRRLGQARNRIFECSYSDPTPRDIVGATLFGQAEANEDAA